MIAPRLIGLAGRAGVGKSTVARLLCEQHAFVEVALAAPIKRADRKSTRLNSSHIQKSRMPSSA